jgi:Bacterial regulatory helix-turn-helix protein, lysR family
VARSGSLTGAAQALKTSAATVGRHITALEGRLGARLFDRAQTGYVAEPFKAQFHTLRTARVRAVMDFLADVALKR